MILKFFYLIALLFHIVDAKEIDSIFDLYKIKNNDTIYVKSFHKGLNKGGGTFIFDKNLKQSLHNGGTIIARDKIFHRNWKKNSLNWFDNSNSSKYGCWVRVVKDKILKPEYFGAFSNGKSSDSYSIEKTIKLAREKGYSIVLSGKYAISKKIVIKSNIKIIGNTINSGFIAISKLPSLISINNSNNISIKKLLLDANNLIHGPIIKCTGVKNISIENCRLKNWKYGIVVNSSKNIASKNINIFNNYIFLPSSITGAVYPIQINNIHPRPLIENVNIKNNTIIGSGGSYTIKNKATADQIALQGVKNFIVSDNILKNSGEVGITASRLSKNGKIFSNTISGSDADAIAIGGAYIKLTVSDTKDIKINSLLKGEKSNAIAVVKKISKKFLFCSKARKSKFLSGENIIIKNKILFTRVLKITETRDIEIYNNNMFNNAKNLNNIQGAWAGIKLQMTDNIAIHDNTCYNNNPNHGGGWCIHLTHATNTSMYNNICKNNKSGKVSKNGATTIISRKKR